MADPARDAGSRKLAAAPDSLDAQFKAAMRRLAAGVALITTEHGGRRYGMTATAVSSLTVDPPALTVSVNRSASMYAPLMARGEFCVNLLRDSHLELCRSFSGAASGERFHHGVWRDHSRGLPYLADSQAAIICRMGPSLTFATHTVFVGEVVSIVLDEEVAPLIYLDGDYCVAKRQP
jgi:flavin reductase (DIM6/NTAB) family NADH-FMN oxidoreductase RutF